jgi:Zn-dependent protease
MLFEPNRTDYDLRWEMYGVPIRVHPSFWLVSVILGWSFIEIGLEAVASWVACSFVSILLHEFGHVLMGRVFGSRGHIVLYSFGGLAIGSNALNNRWKRVAVSAAGPGIQLALWAILWLFQQPILGSLMSLGQMGKLIYLQLYVINLYWPLLNLLPIWPLDGGQISRNTLEGLSPRNGLRTSLVVSIATAGFFAINSLMAMNGQPVVPWLPSGGMLTVMFFGMFAVENYQELQRVNSDRHFTDDHWDR